MCAHTNLQEEEVLEYKEVSDFAQELAQALLEQDTPPGSQGGGSQPKPKGSQQQQQGPPTVRVVPPPAHGGPLKVEVDFRLQEGSGTFTLR